MTAIHFNSRLDEGLIRLLKNGAVGILPVDTVYGLVAVANNKDAIQKMYGLKPREKQPGTTIAASAQQLVDLGFRNEDVSRVSHWWPSPLSVEMSASGIPEYLRVGQKFMAARIPDKDDLLRLLEIVGPLMTTSANPSGVQTATSALDAYVYFKNDVDFYVDVGDIGYKEPSTIIGVDDSGNIKVYREGAFKIEK